jgi:hypothetical protein
VKLVIANGRLFDVNDLVKGAVSDRAK